MRLVIIFALLAIGVFIFQNIRSCLHYKEALINSTGSSSTPPNSKQYQQYDKQSNNPTFLALKNSANIEYIHEQIESVLKIKETIDQMQADINKNAAALKQIGNQLQQGSNQLIGVKQGEKPVIPEAKGLSTAPP